MSYMRPRTRSMARPNNSAHFPLGKPSSAASASIELTRQDDVTVVAELCVPSVRAAGVETHVEETLFSVYIHRYCLRFNFPHPVLEDDDSAALYDPSSGTLIVRLTKETKSQHFSDLGLLAKLRAPRSAAALNEQGHARQPLIEVLENNPDSLAAQLDDKLQLDEHKIFAQAAENDWQIEQTPPDDDLPSVSTATRTAYGFLDLRTGYLVHVTSTENEVNKLGAEAENATLARRRELREEYEENKWDKEHYLAEFVDNDTTRELVKWSPKAYRTMEGQFTFGEEENMTMLCLPRREYLLSPS